LTVTVCTGNACIGGPAGGGIGLAQPPTDQTRTTADPASAARTEDNRGFDKFVLNPETSPFRQLGGNITSANLPASGEIRLELGFSS
jgi:hypothetical protein